MRAFVGHLGAAARQRAESPKPRGEETELDHRLPHPWHEWYPRAHTGVNVHGIRCKIRPIFLPPENRGEPALFALEVIPLQAMPSTIPPVANSPWHISLDFVKQDARQRWRITKITRRYYHAPEKILRGEVQGSMYVLDTQTDDIATDPDVRAIHFWGDYSHRPLHISL